jgi:riboflavin transporter FmnP
VQSTKTQAELIQRRPILSARQIAVAVIFGAIAAAFELLQITIPGYLPGVNFNFGGIWLMLSTMIGGPIAGAVVTFVDSITGQVGIIGWPGYMIHVLILAAFYPRVYRIQSVPKRLGAFLLLTALALFFQYWWWIGLYSFVLKIIPFVTQLSVQALAYWGFLAIYFIIPALLLWQVPKYVAPQWRWPWAKEKMEEEAVTPA